MLVSRWLRTPRVRRSIAAGSLVLSVGGLVLLRAPSSSAHPSKPTFVQISSNGNVNGGSGDPTKGVTFSGPGLHGTFALDDTHVLAGNAQQMFAEVRMTADKVEGDTVRAPLSLAVVLDHSGSMQGGKLQDAKQSIQRLVSELRDDDEIAFVKYDDKAELLQPLARVGGVRSSLLRTIDGITADNGTNISGGLAAGEAALEGAKEGRVKRIILLSDGLDSTRPESERIASNGTEKHVTTSSIGIGLDFNEAYMSSVARSGHGNFAFVNDTQPGSGTALASFLTRELTQGANTTVQGATVRLHLPPGVHFVSASGADGRALDGNDVELRVGDLVAGDERRVVVEMASSLSAGDKGSFDGTLSWSKLDGTRADATLAKIEVVASSDEKEVDGARDPEVTASAFSVFASKREIEAAEAYSSGNYAQAQAITVANQNAATSLSSKLAGMVGGSAPAAALSAQADSYQGTAHAFASSPPGSDTGRAAAKAAVTKDSANMGARAF